MAASLKSDKLGYLSFIFRLEGKVAIITGAANGIGATTARLFAHHGCKVIIADIDDKNGNSVAQEIGPEYALFIHCDVRIESHVQNAVDTTVSRYGKLDIMFSNAGNAGRRDTSILEANLENINLVFDTNVVGSFFCAKHAARVMIPARKGSIIFSASASTAAFGITSHTYTASKCAIVGLCKSLCVEMGKYGIRSNCVSAAIILTKLGMSIMPTQDRKLAEEIVAEAPNLKGVSLTTEDVAEAALYLAGDESKYVSGVNLIIDGGYSTTNIGFQVAVEKVLGGGEGTT
ncbi:PREDICTED: secoisolariciresinol dehydrogenase-like [Ipomoea nil]|uniref:secoisolariciresinol dehydrogenase-like n=1 Tax=Ipomoea nil TaxID=35883 RepID=UPI000900CF8A|nr:PREDICTED: secoisolariciresinol dehydrogenase-like [Ipomoea nil]